MDSGAPKHSINWHSWIATAIGVGTVLVGLVVLGMKIGDLIGRVERLTTDSATNSATNARIEEKLNAFMTSRTEDRDSIAHLKVDMTSIARRLELVEQRRRRNESDN